MQLSCSPYGITITPNGAYAYVACPSFGAGTISIINTTTYALKTIIINASPVFVAISPNGGYAYVTDNKNGEVTVINTTSYKVTETVQVGKGPTGIALTPNGAYAYVTNNENNSVSIINTSTYSMKTIQVNGSPIGITMSPNGAYAYVLDNASTSLSVINTTTYNVNTISLCPNPAPGLQGVTVSPDGAYVYASCPAPNNVDSPGTLLTMNTTTHKVYSTPVGIYPYGIVVSPNGSYVYVANYGSGTISLIHGFPHNNMSSRYALWIDNPSSDGAVTPTSGYYQSGSNVTITATPNPGYGFAGWLCSDDNGSVSYAYCDTSSNVTIKMNGNITEIARFLPLYNVSIRAGPGGTVSPSSGYHMLGTTINITATPHAGYSFIGWTTCSDSNTASNTAYCGPLDSVKLAVYGNISETASFLSGLSSIPYALNQNISFNGSSSVSLKTTQDYELILVGADGLWPWNISLKVDGENATKIAYTNSCELRLGTYVGNETCNNLEDTGTGLGSIWYYLAPNAGAHRISGTSNASEFFAASFRGSPPLSISNFSNRGPAEVINNSYSSNLTITTVVPNSLVFLTTSADVGSLNGTIVWSGTLTPISLGNGHDYAAPGNYGYYSSAYFIATNPGIYKVFATETNDKSNYWSDGEITGVVIR